MWWNRFRWCSRRARARQILARAAAAQEAAHREAIKRIMAANTGRHPSWNDPTVTLDNRPLMTPGQKHRSRNRRKPLG